MGGIRVRQVSLPNQERRSLHQPPGLTQFCTIRPTRTMHPYAVTQDREQHIHSEIQGACFCGAFAFYRAQQLLPLRESDSIARTADMALQDPVLVDHSDWGKRVSRPVGIMGTPNDWGDLDAAEPICTFLASSSLSKPFTAPPLLPRRQPRSPKWALKLPPRPVQNSESLPHVVYRSRLRAWNAARLEEL